MACNTIEKYLTFRWIGQILYRDDAVAITFDKQYNRYEIAYLMDRYHEHGKVRCAPFKALSDIVQAVYDARSDGASDMRAITEAVRYVTCNQ